MIDIVGVGADIRLFDSQVPKATNILSVQLGSLEYEPNFGIDLAYFLSEDFIFQNESFKAYLVQILANSGVNVASIDEALSSLYSNLNIELSPDEQSTSLVR
jgi:hypothetical protein